jgi:hypothetical protein
VDGTDLTAAVVLARRAVGSPADGLPAEAVIVRRLDRDSEYALVSLGLPGEPGWVAAVDPATGVMSWAANQSGSTVPSRPAGLTGDATLVWQPSVQSRSPLYPLLRLSGPDGEVFVDLDGRTHESLGDSRG